MNNCNFNFVETFKLCIGEDSTYRFWDDAWLDGRSLKDRFNRLYRLESEKDTLVRDRISCNGSAWVCHWNWCREPNGRVRCELDSLVAEIAAIPRSASEGDKWKWINSSDGILKTKILSSLVDDQILDINDEDKETMRNNFVPLSLNIFSWRVKRKRIPVRVELDKRGIDMDSVRCPTCNDDIESTDHAMIFCKHALNAWDRVFKWWGLGNFSNWSIHEILNGDGCGAQTSIGRKLWQAVEWVSGYLIWKNRNQKVFRDKMWSGPSLLNEIQIKSYEWIARRAKSLDIEWHQWLVNPRQYLDYIPRRSGIY
ncbi:uncharacterized protein [Rutidosis leptorrhynchoides]|uniref:uncharacterized protein n=1 Tax=Rutidosis leptorrhynchoides TaxID=125765 RepID=UPI003A995208